LSSSVMAGRSLDIRYATTRDGVSIAFTTVGQGEPLVVLPEPVLHCFHPDFEHPSPRAWYERLSRDRTVVRFDTRGSGLSEADVSDFSLSALQLDLEAVVDELGMRTFNLLGQEDASQIAIAYAVRSPERIRKLVLWDAFSASRLLPQQASLETMERLIDQNWPLWMELAVQSIYAWRGPEADMYAQSLTQAVPANAALAFLTAAWEWNVTDLLPLVKCPTLVVHRRDQAFFPMRLGMAIAGGIRGARLQIVEGASSFPWVGEWETCARIIDEFLADEGAEPRASRRRGASGGRVLATVLFTDIVSSTQRAAELGDRRWQALLRAHDELTRRELARFGGQSVKSVGDGFLATFERPERGVRCATSIIEGVRGLGLQVRAGVHTGEIETEGDDIHGIGVHIGARVAALAAPGEVLVTKTVAELVTGSGVRFAERGEHELKGVPGRWVLLAVVG
jgi:class 3 adenylate cyclase/pimeloyl-ACP methyl ester carboxylesterase